MVDVGPPSGAKKAVHDGGFLVALAGLFLLFLGFDAPTPTLAIVGGLLALGGGVMVWLGSRRPRKPVPATVPSSG